MKRQRNAASSALMRQTSLTGGLTGIEAERAASASHPKWQVQNRVGGGSLYGVADGGLARPSGSRGGSSSYAHAPSTPTSPVAREGGSGGSVIGSLGASAVAGHSGAEAVPTTPSGGRGKIEGIDIVYLKNVLLKFMEAAVTGKVAERDVLLPAVAAILQASPAEFAILKKMFVNTTTPPAMQMLSAFGIKLS